MEKREQRMLKAEIKDISYLNIEEQFLMFKYCLLSFINSLSVYGYRDPITQEVRMIWQNFKKNILEEKSLFAFLLDNSSKIELTSAYDLIDMLEEVNEALVEYLIDALDDIDTACELRERWRAHHRHFDIELLADTDKYRMEAQGLLLDFEDIKAYFSYPNAFWEYIAPRMMIIDSRDPASEAFYGVLMKYDEGNKLCDIKIIVPRIINLATALINVHEIKHAYDLYQNKEDLYEEEYEKRAKEMESDFIKKLPLSNPLL